MTQKNRLYIGNLEYSVTSQELHDFLASDYDISDCRVIEGKGFGFVTFASDEIAAAAKEALSDKEFRGRSMKIDFAKEERRRSPRPSRY